MNQLFTKQSLGVLLLSLLLPVLAWGQGVTTASLNGRVTDANGEPLVGATVVAVHTPSGSVYGNNTGEQGFYRIPNMRVGGPYEVKVTYVGYEPYERSNIVLSLGQSYQLNASLQETSITTKEVEITSSRSDVFDGNRTGQETFLNERKINDMPTVSRSLADYARLNPLATVSEGSDGFSFSLAGQNNRYNNIYIDGVVSNDAFGLAGSGTDGGQTGVQPISIDAIEALQISVAPFDVRQSGFAGGAVSAITRSGTNSVEASAYGFFRNNNLAGLNPLRPTFDSANVESREAYRDEFALPEFAALTTGFRVGGPIIKDKLFFFVNAELQRDNTPQPFLFENYLGESSQEEIENLADFVQNTYGYDVGDYLDNTASLNSEKFLVKFDYNINQNNKLSLRHQFVQARNLEARSSSPGSINFINGSEFFTSTTNSTALELSSLIGSRMSNTLRVGLKFVRDDRDPFGDPFPTVFLEDGNNGGINFGAERFSTANLLNQDVITINDDFEFYAGRNNFLVGVNLEYFNAGNLFIRNNYGRYRYFNEVDTAGNIVATGVDQFLAQNPLNQEFERSFSQVDNIAGDESDAIAAFQQLLVGVYFQDQIQVTNDFKLTAGIRIDVPFWLTDQPINEDFNNTTIPAIEEVGYSLRGAQTGTFIDPQITWAPRVGFNWDIGGNRTTQLRGGAGLFTSRIPLVWPGGAYNNYGFNIGETGGTNVPFNPDVQEQPVGFDDNGDPILEVNTENPTPSGQIDLFAEDFQLPQALKVNLALDQKLPGGLVLTLQGLYTKNVNQVRYENLNLRPSEENLTGTPDDRPIYQGLNPAFGGNPIDPTYTNIILASNTNLGYSYNLVAQLSKLFENGFSGSFSYTYGDSYSVFDGTSSQNNSQWRGYFSPSGRNNIGDIQPMRSDFAQGHRVIAQASYEVEWAGFMRTQLSFFYNGQSGNPFTYVVGAQNFEWVDDGGFGFNELVYIPETQSDIVLREVEVGGTTYTADEQWNILNAYISDNPSLDNARGGYAERNAQFLPFEHSLDVRLLHDFYIEMDNGKRNTIQLSADVFNFLNLLNKDWGRRRGFSFGTYSLVNLETLDNDNTPIYSVTPEILEGEEIWADDIDDSGFRSSRWYAQFGVRYIFE